MSRMPFSPLSKTTVNVKSSRGKTSFTAGYIASILLKRFNLERLFAIRDETPIGHQFFLMQISPGQHQPRLPCRQISFNDFASAYVHGCLVLIVVWKCGGGCSRGAKYIR